MANRRNQIKAAVAQARPAPTVGPAVGPGHPASGVGLGQSHPAGARPPAAGPAAATPAPAAASTPMPWDVQASNDEAGAAKGYSDSLSRIASNWQLTQQDYGLEGPYANYESNPYSKAAQLQTTYNNAQRGSLNSMASRGQLYAGSLVNARNHNTNNFNVSYDALQKAYAQAGASKVAEEAGAREQEEEAIRAAQWKRINSGLEAAPEAAPEPATAPSNKYTAPKQKNNPGKKKGR